MGNECSWGSWKHINNKWVKPFICCGVELTDNYIEISFDTLIYSYRISFCGPKTENIKSLYNKFYHLHFKTQYHFHNLEDIISDMDIFLNRINSLVAFS